MKAPSNPEKRCLLLLIRHGKAASKNVGLTDFERILTRTGKEESNRVAAATKGKLRSVDLMLSSPADRALETAHIFAGHWKYPVKNIRIVESVYFADTIRPLIKIIQSLGHIVHTVGIFGHNPLFDELAAYWIPGFHRTIPKSAVLGIEFDAVSWADVCKGGGQLLYFLTPTKSGVQPDRRSR